MNSCTYVLVNTQYFYRNFYLLNIFIKNMLKKCVSFFEDVNPSQKEIGLTLLVLRVVVGIFFIKFGYGKLFGTPGIEGFTGMLTNFGFFAPSLFAYLVGIAEFFGGIAILLGVFTRFSAFWIAIIAFFAWAKVKGFGLAMGMLLGDKAFSGGSVDFLSLGLLIALVIAGPGIYSVSAKMKKDNI